MDRQATVEVRILGSLVAAMGGVDRTPTSRRERHALSLLAIHREVSSEQFVEALWPAPPPTARTSLHVAIGRLRNLLGPDSIVRVGSNYRLARSVIVDYDEFRQLYESPDTEDWQRVVDMTSRRVLDDLHDDRDIRAFAHLVQRHRRRLCIQLAQHFLDVVGDPYQALDVLERDAFDEPDDPIVSSLIDSAREQVRTGRLPDRTQD